MLQAGNQAHEVRRAASAVVPRLAGLATSAQERVYVEETAAVEPPTGKEPVIESSFDQFRKTGLPGY